MRAKSKARAKRSEKGKWGVTETRAEQEAEKLAMHRRLYSPEMRNQVHHLTNVSNPRKRREINLCYFRSTTHCLIPCGILFHQSN